ALDIPAGAHLKPDLECLIVDCGGDLYTRLCGCRAISQEGATNSARAYHGTKEIEVHTDSFYAPPRRPETDEEGGAPPSQRFERMLDLGKKQSYVVTIMATYLEASSRTCSRQWITGGLPHLARRE